MRPTHTQGRFRALPTLAQGRYRIQARRQTTTACVGHNADAAGGTDGAMEAGMARIAIEMPKLGYDMESGRIGSWVKQVGDTVARGDIVAEIETEKSTVEMEALTSGTLVEIVAQPGAELPVGAVIGWLEDEG